MINKANLKIKDTKLHKNARKNAKTNAKVNVVDFAGDKAYLKRAPIKNIFGKENMYLNRSKLEGKERKLLEDKLAALERQASVIINKILEAHESGHAETSLLPLEISQLRKFVFIMKYRSPLFFNRYNHESICDYVANDRETFVSYADSKGFTRPLDVWFDNLLKIIDMPPDAQHDWVMELMHRIYPPDALWLMIHLRCMYPVLVTPKDPQDKFILTENSFGIHEGPVDISINPETYAETMTLYTEYHVLCILSPDLTLILRHNSLPEETGDEDENVRLQKQQALLENARQFREPQNAYSILHDLPVRKSCNTGDQLMDGFFSVAAEKSDEKQDQHISLPFCSIETRHAQLINLIMLDQGHKTSSLVFESKSALVRAIEFYLEYPIHTKGLYSLKTFTERLDDKRLIFLKKIEKFAHCNGSKVKARYHVDPVGEEKHETDKRSLGEVVLHVLQSTQILLLDKPPAMAIVIRVMMAVLVKMGWTIPVVHALDSISLKHGAPTFPEYLYITVQRIPRTRLNSRCADVFVNLDLRIWKLSWGILLDKAGLKPVGDRKEALNILNRMQKSPGVDIEWEAFADRVHNDHLNDVDIDEQQIQKRLISSSRNTWHRASELKNFSQRGLKKALESIGEDISLPNPKRRDSFEVQDVSSHVDAASPEIVSEVDDEAPDTDNFPSKAEGGCIHTESMHWERVYRQEFEGRKIEVLCGMIWSLVFLICYSYFR